MSRHTEENNRLITPLPISNPNLKATDTEIDLHPITLWPIGAILSVLVFPGELDKARLESSIAKVCSIWPNAVGRFQKKPRPGAEGEWDFTVALTGSPLPISYREITADRAFPDDLVIQPNLAGYVPDMPPTLGIPDSDSPQVLIRVTTMLPSRRSILGLLWGHLLGDAASAHRFLQHLSMFYSDASASLPADEYPSFYPHITISRYPPTQEVIDKYATTQIKPVPIMGEGGMVESYVKTAAEDEQLTVVLTPGELAQLRERVSAAAGIRLSDQDALSGWWVTILRQSEDISGMVYTVNYRNIQKDHPCFPSNLPTLSANVAQMRLLGLPPASEAQDPYEAAAAVGTVAREFLYSLKNDPESALDWLSVPAHFMEQAAINTQAQIMVPVEGQCLVNSNLRYDWVCDFGFAHNDVAYHTIFSTVRFLRVFQANGSGKAGERNIELTWSVKKGGAKERTLELVRRSKKDWVKASSSGS